MEQHEQMSRPEGSTIAAESVQERGPIIKKKPEGNLEGPGLCADVAPSGR